MKPIVPSAIGMVVFAAAQGVWSWGHAYSGWRGAWLLKSPTGIAACLILLAITAAVACAFQRKLNAVVPCALFFALGAIVAMTIALFIIGPGNLWPMVIAFDSVMIGAAVAAGAAVGAVVGIMYPRR
jgi:hypothetical protein